MLPEASPTCVELIHVCLLLHMLFSVLNSKHYITTCKKLANTAVTFVFLINSNH